MLIPTSRSSFATLRQSQCGSAKSKHPAKRITVTEGQFEMLIAVRDGDTKKTWLPSEERSWAIANGLVRMNAGCFVLSDAGLNAVAARKPSTMRML